MDVWQVLVGVVGGLFVVWAALIGAMLWAARGNAEKLTLIGALRLGPQ